MKNYGLLEPKKVPTLFRELEARYRLVPTRGNWFSWDVGCYRPGCCLATALYLKRRSRWPKTLTKASSCMPGARAQVARGLDVPKLFLNGLMSDWDRTGDLNFVSLEQLPVDVQKRDAVMALTVHGRRTYPQGVRYGHR